GQQGCHLQGDPAVHTIGPVMDGSKQVCGLREVLESQFKEEFFARLVLLELLANRVIVGSTLLDCLLEDRRVRGQARYRELVNIVLERAPRPAIAGEFL